MAEIISVQYLVKRLQTNLNQRIWGLFFEYSGAREDEARMKFKDMQENYGADEVRLEKVTIEVLEGPIR